MSKEMGIVHWCGGDENVIDTLPWREGCMHQSLHHVIGSHMHRV